MKEIGVPDGAEEEGTDGTYFRIGIVGYGIPGNDIAPVHGEPYISVVRQFNMGVVSVVNLKTYPATLAASTSIVS